MLFYSYMLISTCADGHYNRKKTLGKINLDLTGVDFCTRDMLVLLRSVL